MLIPVVLTGLVLLGMACAVGALFLKYRLDYARALSVTAVRDRVGMEFSFGDLRTEGVRMLHVTDLHLAAPVPGFGKATLDANALRLRLSLPDLLWGRIAVGEAFVQGAHLVLEDHREAREAGDRPPARPGGAAVLPGNLPYFLLRGEDCSVEIRTPSLEQPVFLQEMAFSLSNQPEASLLSGDMRARLVHDKNTADIGFEGYYRPQAGFDVTFDVKGLHSAAIAPFAALPEGLSGALDGSIHAWGSPERQVMATVDVAVQEFNLPGLPVPVEDMAGVLNAVLQWDVASQKINVLECIAVTPLASLNLNGNLDLQPTPPEMNLTAIVSEVQVNDLIARLLPEAAREMGQIDVTLPDNVEARLTASGPVTQPQFTGRLLVPELDLAFKPADKQLPTASLTLASGDFLFEGIDAMPVGSVNITGGKIASAAFGVEADGLAGTVAIAPSGITVRPLVAQVSGKPFSGEAHYALPDGTLSFAANGMLVDIETTPLHNITHGLWIEGDVGFNASGVYARNGKITLKASADVTRGMVAFEWWLRKPIGVGATIQDLELEIIPGKSMQIQGEAFVEDTHVKATFDYRDHEGKWKNRHIRVDLPHLEVNSAGKCFNIPYIATGGVCRDGFYERRVAGTHVDDNIATVGGVFDYVSFLPEGGEAPLICRDATVAVTLTSIKGVENKAELTVHAADAQVPPFTDTWLLPLGSDDPEYTDEYALKYFKADAERKRERGVVDTPRPWTHTLSADSISVPPWEGRNFSARLQTNNEETRFDFFRAEVGEGSLEGTYSHEKEDNVAQLTAVWEGIPAKYIIRHLELPEILAGDISGKVEYVVDQDDPRSTMRSDGEFTIVNGHFLGDALREAFQHTFSDSFAALHPAALRFDKISSDLRIAGDQIHTDNLLLQSQGMSIKANGVWVMEGDLDYRIDIAVSPDLAEQLPMLRDSFNVQGFRMTQRDIELGFHLTGPTFSPTGQLAGLPPIGVTVVSGAAEMTGEAMRLLDTPRQVLLSIFRVGGGILGATRTQQQQQQQQQ